VGAEVVFVIDGTRVASSSENRREPREDAENNRLDAFAEID
jgi:hypothetical protein